MINLTTLQEKNINKVQTAKQARTFLNKDLDRILAIAGMHRTDLLHPSQIKVLSVDSPTPIVLRIISAQTLVKCCSLAINDIKDLYRKPYKSVLVETYINELPCYQVASSLGYSDSRYRLFKHEALNLFSLGFTRYQLQNGISNPINLCSFSN